MHSLTILAFVEMQDNKQKSHIFMFMYVEKQICEIANYYDINFGRIDLFMAV